MFQFPVVQLKDFNGLTEEEVNSEFQFPVVQLKANPDIVKCVVSLRFNSLWFN